MANARDTRMVMIVDSEPAQQRFLSALVSRGGWRSVVAGDTDTALAKLGTQEGMALDAVLVDQGLLDQIAAYKVVMTGLPADAGPKFPAELSGGMKKRAGLARALALDPELLFLDEPTAGLDPIGAAAFDELTASLQKTLGLTVFLITHDLDTLYAICDRVAVLADKKVIGVGTIDELLAMDHPWIQEYFNGPRGRAATATLERDRQTEKAGAQD